MIPINVRGKGGKFLWARMLRGIPKKNEETCRIKEERNCSGLEGETEADKIEPARGGLGLLE